MAIAVSTVGELIEALKRFDPSTPVLVTWEGTTQDASVYRGKDGRCLIDADDCVYEPDFSDGSM